MKDQTRKVIAALPTTKSNAIPAIAPLSRMRNIPRERDKHWYTPVDIKMA
jgi:hypothetical protein